MGKSKTNVEDYLPDPRITFLGVAAKAFTQRKKELQQEALAKAAQRGEMLKAIIPHYLENIQSQQEWERNLPFKYGEQAFKERELAQEWKLGLAGISAQIAGIENQWTMKMADIASSEKITGQKIISDETIASLDRALRSNLEGIRAIIQNKEILSAEKIARGGVESAEKIAGMEITGRKEISAAEIVGRETVAGIETAAAQRIAKWQNENAIRIQEMREKADKFPRALSEQVDMYQSEAALATQAWATALIDPKVIPVANMLSQMVNARQTQINAALEAEGGAPLIPMPLPGLVRQDRMWPRKDLTVPVIPGITPAPTPVPTVTEETKAIEFDRYVEGMVKQGATRLSDKDRTILQSMGIDADAVEAAARKRQGK